MKRFENILKMIVIIVIAVLLIITIVKISSIKISDKKTNIENIFILEQLRSAAKLVIWEQDFYLNNITEKQKKYFNIDFLTFTEKLITTARGRIGFHIDLADTINTKINVKKDIVEIYSPLRLTYITIDNSTINQIAESSIDPSLKINKEDVIKQLNELALRENLNPAIMQARNASLEKQEENLQKLTDKKVKIIITDYPTIEESISVIRKKS